MIDKNTDPQTIIDMIRRAYSIARATRRDTYIVADEISETGWAVDTDRRRIDRLILGPIKPPPFDAMMMMEQAPHHIEQAMPHLRRAAEMIAANPDGSLRSRADVDDILDEVLRHAVDSEWERRRKELPDYPHLVPKPGNFFTRLFGSR